MSSTNSTQGENLSNGWRIVVVCGATQSDPIGAFLVDQYSRIMQTIDASNLAELEAAKVQLRLVAANLVQS